MNSSELDMQEGFLLTVTSPSKECLLWLVNVIVATPSELETRKC